ncbi:Hypothetical predicted protein [Mytilus galloprovincialis]|uniref:Uncharacterized protein n=1 Tax=Mytilus galloprovincialis TaxID=29158 RepID=A0A8B6FWV5_MYTGA|nr:Hypothetical predicted protein [Mytilus galloprovincialis]
MQVKNVHPTQFYKAQGQSYTLEGEFLAQLKVTDGLKLHNSRVGEMHCSSDSYESDSESFKSDSPYYRNAAKSLPSSTQKWTSTMLESLGIYYNNDFHKSPTDILNMITEDTGIFGGLTEQQNLYVEGMKNSMTFDCTIQDFIEIMQKKNMFTVLDKEIANIKELRKEVPYTSLAEDFIRSVKMMLTHYFHFYTKSIRCPAFHNPVPKDRFVHIFRSFARICNLIVEPGSAWKGEMVLGKSHVVSAADLVLLPDNSESALSVVMVVTVFEAKSSKSLHLKSNTEDQNGKKKPKMSSEDTASSDSEEHIHLKPAIYSKIPQNILAQHGVELLIHHPYYRKELNLTKHELHYMNYLPGMIVIGTEVVLTLLKIDDFHVADLKINGFSVKRKATIYYSEPKDLLKKIDRDLLFDSFAKLCNI